MLLLSHDHIQNLLREGDDDPAGQGQKPIGALRRIVGFQRESDLHDAKPQQDQSDGSDQAEDEGRQIVHCRDWISRCECCCHPDCHRTDDPAVHCGCHAALTSEPVRFMIASFPQLHLLLIVILLRYLLPTVAGNRFLLPAPSALFRYLHQN